MNSVSKVVAMLVDVQTGLQEVSHLTSLTILNCAGAKHLDTNRMDSLMLCLNSPLKNLKLSNSDITSLEFPVIVQRSLRKITTLKIKQCQFPPNVHLFVQRYVQKIQNKEDVSNFVWTDE